MGIFPAGKGGNRDVSTEGLGLYPTLPQLWLQDPWKSLARRNMSYLQDEYRVPLKHPWRLEREDYPREADKVAENGEIGFLSSTFKRYLAPYKGQPVLSRAILFRIAQPLKILVYLLFLLW